MGLNFIGEKQKEIVLQELKLKFTNFTKTKSTFYLRQKKKAHFTLFFFINFYFYTVIKDFHTIYLKSIKKQL
jgi:hypothetical protein